MQLEEHPAHGVYNVNKPLEMSSHGVVSRMRRMTGVKRIGHAGTLDPLATGVLVVLVGRQFTRRQAEFMAGEKEYEAEITFGSVSATYDAEGPLEQTATLEQLQALDPAAVEATLPQFTGTIQQRPPAHSAIKVGGEALYKKARRGELASGDAEIPMREVTIDEIELLGFVGATPPFPPTARIRVRCQKGVYIRSLAHDIGQQLGVGAYMSGLTRTRVGEFTLDTAQTLEQLEEQFKKQFEKQSAE